MRILCGKISACFQRNIIRQNIFNGIFSMGHYSAEHWALERRWALEGRRWGSAGGSDPSGGVKVVGLCTNHRLSPSEQTILLVRPIATSFAPCSVPILRKRRQIAGREEVHTGNAKCRAQFAIDDAVRQVTPIGLEVTQWSHGVYYTQNAS